MNTSEFTNSSSQTYTKELSLACAAAVAGANAICEVAERAKKNPLQKDDDQGPVTEADLNADRAISELIRGAFPDDALVTEETWDLQEPLPKSGRVWIVDPLDGTKSFVEGSDDYVVMIGLCVDGEPVVGVLLQPQTGLLWRGNVTTKKCQRMQLMRHKGLVTYQVADLERAFDDVKLASRNDDGSARFVLSHHHRSKNSEWLSEALGVEVVRKSSVGLKIGLICDDEADAYLTGSNQIKVWDTCGPAAVLHAADGTVTDLDGQKLVFTGPAAHQNGVLAADPETHIRYADRIVELAKQWRSNRSR
ncbi:MAG: hypothetical protein GY822_11065 [Deltaproteobacteria bacterium]|nr:hypothetical protein [Deltaproteobacteria bacterium]